MSQPVSPPPIAPPKASWIPLTLAVLVPLAFIGMVLATAGRERTNEGLNIFEGPTRGVQTALVRVELNDRREGPVSGRAVIFSHRTGGEDPVANPGQEQIYQAVSDSAGLATVSLPKIGALIVEVDGFERKTILPAMEMHGSREIKIRLHLD